MTHQTAQAPSTRPIYSIGAVGPDTRSRVSKLLKAALNAGIIGPDVELAGFLDIDGITATVKTLKSSFPSHFTHLFAAKSNTMFNVLKLIRECGMGCEAASPAELEQALRAGFPPRRISFDEPAKTEPTLRKVISLGAGLHIDNFQEFERVRLIASEIPPVGPVGFRLNPQRGAGRIQATSTATPTSKFGIALRDPGNREKLIQLYRSLPWLNSLHVHAGAQGCPLELLASSVADAVALAEDINRGLDTPKVNTIDIGGGLPVNFESDTVTPTFADYAAVLRRRVPELFSGRYRVFTEFGRAVLAKHGLLASRVEYVKHAGGRGIALSHAGAQIAARTVNAPEYWALRCSAYDAQGVPRAGEPRTYDIAGPCCFSGDLLARGIEMPPIEANDWIAAHDTGAYYLAVPYFFNALPVPAVYGYRASGETLQFQQFRKEQSIDQVLAVIG